MFWIAYLLNLFVFIIHATQGKVAWISLGIIFALTVWGYFKKEEEEQND
jgi:hypothetical protein